MWTTNKTVQRPVVEPNVRLLHAAETAEHVFHYYGDILRESGN